MKILAADDESLQLARLERCIAEAIPGAEIESFSQPSKIVQWVEAGGQGEIAFLDVEMGSMTGIQVAKKILAANPQTNVIFVTGYTEYALDAFKIHASGYITKPVSTEKIKKEMGLLRFRVSDIFARTFGDFDLFVGGEAVAFTRAKSKEMLAYLIAKNGGTVSRKELAAVLFEDDYSPQKQNYVAKLYSDLVKDLKAVKASEILMKAFNQYSVNTTAFSCDYYEYLAGNPSALAEYKGEFMAQYEWGEV